ncbi:hypothetical protein HK102_001826 [Quaeritorhiza haematococci]|nr:hypothetical protein HK102_001826 [Quaeritorhiza haematococci]
MSEYSPIPSITHHHPHRPPQSSSSLDDDDFDNDDPVAPDSEAIQLQNLLPRRDSSTRRHRDGTSRVSPTGGVPRTTTSFDGERMPMIPGQRGNKPYFLLEDLDDEEEKLYIEEGGGKGKESEEGEEREEEEEGSLELELDKMGGLLDRSPVPEVQAVVPTTDDPSLPTLTFRFWAISTVFTVVIAGAAQFFYFRLVSLSLTGFIIQMLSFPVGKAMARYLPRNTWLNPGPFNIKEHALIVIAASTATSSAYAIDILSVQRIYYNQNIGAVASLLLLGTTQCLGYGMAGFLRKYLVRPAHMVTVFHTMHRPPGTRITPTTPTTPSGSTSPTSRTRFFLLTTTLTTFYQLLPNFFAPLLTWISPICILGGKSLSRFWATLASGMSNGGFGNVCLDWSAVGGYYPFYTPLWAQLNQYASIIVFNWLLIPLIYYFNIWDAQRFPMFGFRTRVPFPTESNIPTSTLVPSPQSNLTDLIFSPSNATELAPTATVAAAAVTAVAASVAASLVRRWVDERGWAFEGGDRIGVRGLSYGIGNSGFGSWESELPSPVKSGLVSSYNYNGEGERQERHDAARGTVPGASANLSKRANNAKEEEDGEEWVYKAKEKRASEDLKLYPLFNATRVLTKDMKLNETEYANHGPMMLSPWWAIGYGTSFGALTATLVHVYLYHGTEIWRTFRMTRREREEEGDVHARLMRVYDEVPTAWYTLLLLSTILISLLLVTLTPLLQLQWWGVLLAVVLASAFVLPVGVLQAVTGTSIGLNVLSEMVVGFLVPGEPIANVVFKTYGYMAMRQCLDLVGDSKLGHYLKLPPRSLFTAQLWGTLLGSITNYIVMELVLSAVDFSSPVAVGGSSSAHSIPITNATLGGNATATIPISTGTTMRDPQWSARSSATFYTASLIWGAVGPAKLFGWGAMYWREMLWFGVGALLPVPFWWANKRWPEMGWHYINIPILLQSTTSNIYGAHMVLTSLVASLWSHVYVRRRYPRWYKDFTYVLGAGLDVGATLAVVLGFFFIKLPGLEMPRWALNPQDPPDLCYNVVYDQ